MPIMPDAIVAQKLVPIAAIPAFAAAPIKNINPALVTPMPSTTPTIPIIKQTNKSLFPKTSNF